MKIAVFSDVHGNSLALRQMIKKLSEIEYDKIVFLGDIFGYYYNQEECLQMLRGISDLIWLKGNHDKYACNVYCGKMDEKELVSRYGHSYENLKKRFDDDDFGFISALQESHCLEYSNRRIVFFHGSFDNPLEGRIYENTKISEDYVCKYDYVIFGHTHCKIYRKVGNTRIISPGSIGQPRDGKGYGFMVLNLDNDECDFINIEIDNTALKEEIDKHDIKLKKLYDVLSRESGH